MKEPENELYQMALVQSFEFTFELGGENLKRLFIFFRNKKNQFTQRGNQTGFSSSYHCGRANVD